MNKELYKVYIFALITIVITAIIILTINGFSFYNTAITERFFHDDYNVLKPSGLIGHGLGIFGTALIILGIVLYMVRKRSKKMMRLGLLKHWLEFHIFLCTLGTVLILYHTSFKIGGLVSISFWSMVAVFFSGIIGRFIYLQIPRTIEGKELSMKEARNLLLDYQKNNQSSELDYSKIDEVLKLSRSSIKIYRSTLVSSIFSRIFSDFKKLIVLRKMISKLDLSRQEKREAMKLIRKELVSNRKIDQLDFMKKIFQYWHVAHLPFAIVMLVIMLIHVIVALTFGYKWLL